jgi:hypothetical protein
VSGEADRVQRVEHLSHDGDLGVALRGERIERDRRAEQRGLEVVAVARPGLGPRERRQPGDAERREPGDDGRGQPARARPRRSHGGDPRPAGEAAGVPTPP